MKTGAWMMLVLALGAGCSEGETTDPGADAGGDRDGGATVDAGAPGEDASTPGEDASAPGEDASTPGEDAGAPGDGGSPTSTLVINELSAAGDDWIELKNVGEAPLDVAGWIVTQVDDLGMPEPDRSAPFPAGYAIPAGGYFVVVTDQAMPLEGIQTECFVEGVTECLIAEFGISAGSGDTLVVLDETGAEVHRVVYTGGLSVGQTWARIPDGTGEFVVAAPTPGATNATE